jgi:hypothetical protein
VWDYGRDFEWKEGTRNCLPKGVNTPLPPPPTKILPDSLTGELLEELGARRGGEKLRASARLRKSVKSSPGSSSSSSTEQKTQTAKKKVSFAPTVSPSKSSSGPVSSKSRWTGSRGRGRGRGRGGRLTRSNTTKAQASNNSAIFNFSKYKVGKLFVAYCETEKDCWVARVLQVDEFGEFVIAHTYGTYDDVAGKPFYEQVWNPAYISKRDKKAVFSARERPASSWDPWLWKVVPEMVRSEPFAKLVKRRVPKEVKVHLQKHR